MVLASMAGVASCGTKSCLSVAFVDAEVGKTIRSPIVDILQFDVPLSTTNGHQSPTRSAEVAAGTYIEQARDTFLSRLM